MSNRFDTLFSNTQTLKRKAYIASVTLCDPNYEQSYEILKILANYADALSLNLAFSDPATLTIDILESQHRAIANGASVNKSFALIKKLRRDFELPIILNAHANMIKARTTARFYHDAKVSGVDAIFLVDVPSNMLNKSENFALAAQTEQLQIVLNLPALSRQTTAQEIFNLANLIQIDRLNVAKLDTKSYAFLENKNENTHIIETIDGDTLQTKINDNIDAFLIHSSFDRVIKQYANDEITLMNKIEELASSYKAYC